MMEILESAENDRKAERIQDEVFSGSEIPLYQSEYGKRCRLATFIEGKNPNGKKLVGNLI